MFPLQRESGGRVVEVVGVPDLMERRFRMAFGAVLPEPVLMNIAVAVGAIAMDNSPEYLIVTPIMCFCLVAFGTLHLPVLSFQRVDRIVVVESGCRTELIEIVAGGTLCTQRSLMVIGVAGKTFLSQPQVGAGPVLQFIIRNEFFPVTLVAVDLSVLSLQGIPGEAVVEPIFAEPDHFEFPSMMVVVARCTFIAFHIGGGMIPRSGIDPGTDLCVTGETFFVGHFLPQHVALGAVGHPLQLLVGFSQFTRGELSRNRKDGQQQEQEYPPAELKGPDIPLAQIGPQFQQRVY
jgi:hypothetical protein